MLDVSTVGGPAALAIRASLRAFCFTRLMSWECVQATVPIWWSINSMAALSSVKADRYMLLILGRLRRIDEDFAASLRARDVSLIVEMWSGLFAAARARQELDVREFLI